MWWLPFAPDKTVPQSLKEIQTFDIAKVVPPEYVNFITSNIKFHFLDDAPVGLGTMDGSQFSIVISNTQKIILKKRKAQPSAAVENALRNESVSDTDASMVIFAWGGMTVKNAKSIVGSIDHWLEIVSGLRSEKLTYLEAYDRFLAQALQ